MALICEVCGLPTDPPDGTHTRCMLAVIDGRIDVFDMKLSPFQELKAYKQVTRAALILVWLAIGILAIGFFAQ